MSGCPVMLTAVSLAICPGLDWQISVSYGGFKKRGSTFPATKPDCPPRRFPQKKPEMPLYQTICWLFVLFQIFETTFSKNLTTSHLLDHSVSLSEELGQIFDSRNGCDFTIIVQSASGDGHEGGTVQTGGTEICAHKILLSRFPLFNVSEGTASIAVNVSRACHTHFASFIRYIYTRKVEVRLSSVRCFHSFAAEFGVKQLMEDVGRLFSTILPEDVSFHTQVSLYQYAVETGDFALQENCIQYLAWNIPNLTMSPTWPNLSAELLGALLVRSDLVLPDEYFLLQAVESWILEKGSLLSLKAQAALLGHIRFPMIPAERLYTLEVNSSLYDAHKEIYSSKVLKALKFNVLLFRNLAAHPNFIKEDKDYQTRIYTAEPWSTTIVPTRVVTPQWFHHRSSSVDIQYSPQWFSTPLHPSLIFQDNRIQWEAKISKSQGACSESDEVGICASAPLATLVPHNHHQTENIVFRNRLLLVCQAQHICHVQDLERNVADIAVNPARIYPCPDDQYTYRFVVRPAYN